MKELITGLMLLMSISTFATERITSEEIIQQGLELNGYNATNLDISWPESPIVLANMPFLGLFINKMMIKGEKERELARNAKLREVHFNVGRQHYNCYAIFGLGESEPDKTVTFFTISECSINGFASESVIKGIVIFTESGARLADRNLDPELF